MPTPVSPPASTTAAPSTRVSTVIRPPCGGALDDLQRPGGALVDGPAPEELDAPDHDRQEVVEVMGGAAGQPAERPQRLTLDQALLHGAQVAARAARPRTGARCRARWRRD